MNTLNPLAHLHLFEFTSITDEVGEKILHVGGRIADRRGKAEQTEWIDFQFAIEAPTDQGGALLRARALTQASEKLQQLASHFDKIARQRG